MISDVAQLSVSHGFSRVARLTVSGAYAHNESAQVRSYKIETINSSAVLDYNVTRSTKLSLSQQYNQFNIPGVPHYDRLITMLTVSIEW